MTLLICALVGNFCMNRNKRINGSKSVKLLALTVDRCADEKSLPQIKKCIGFRDFIKSQHLNNNILF